jgi:tetratricopeptide (TPR) repeat protein
MSSGSSVRAWWLAVPLVLAVMLAFYPVLANSFVNWDDDRNFIHNPHFRGLGWAQLHWAWTTELLGVYQPVSWMLLEVEYAIWGLVPAGYHLASVLMHAGNCVLLFALARMMQRRCWPGLYARAPGIAGLCAAFAVALFAVHPLRVEAVAWASCQPYLPCAFFYLLAVISYLRAFTPAPAGGARRLGWLTASLVCFALALLSKAVAVSLPFVLLILDVYPLRRLAGARGGWRGAARGVCFEKLPFLLAAVGFMFVAVAAKRETAVLEVVPRPLAMTQLAQAAYGVWFYLWKTVAPGRLIAYYALPAPATWYVLSFLARVLAILAATAIAIRVRRRWPGLTAAWAAYLVILAPNLGLVQISEQIAADRYCYVPMMAVTIGIAAAPLLTRSVASLGKSRAAALASAGVVLVCGLALLSMAQCRTWESSLALWTHANRVAAGRSARIQNFLGLAIAGQGRIDEAKAHFLSAIALQPSYADPHNNLGAVFGEQGRLDEAAFEFAQTIRIHPNDRDAHNNLGTVLLKRGELAAGIAEYAASLRLDPDYEGARNNLESAAAGYGLDPGLVACIHAVLASPRDLRAYHALATALNDHRQP